MHIVIADAFDPSLSERLQAFGTVSEGLDRLSEANVLLIRSKTKCTAEFLEDAPELKLIIRGGVGLDNVDRVVAKEKGITVHNTPKASSIAVAELAFALMISVPNHIVRGHNSMAEGEWIKKQLKRTELFGKTLGLVGIGNIATEVTKRGAAFGMTVKAYDKYVSQSDHAEMVGSLEELVDGADYVSVGRLFPTGSKLDTRPATLDTLRAVRAAVSLPVCAIGGINESNLDEVLAAGADMASVIAAVVAAANVREAARGLAARFPNA